MNLKRHHRQTGAAAILAMMFLVIFGSLAAAMAIVSQGNLYTADAHLKVNRAMAASETGMRFMMYRLNQVTAGVTTTDGEITDDNAPVLWNSVRADLLASLALEFHNVQEPVENGSTLSVGPIAIGPGKATFTATFKPHPLADENYDAAYYQRPPYSELETPVSEVNPLDSTWIRVVVTAADGPANRSISRSIRMDFRITKRIKFAILSKSRVMIGRNVMISGPIGSRFLETPLKNGHPVQMKSDFEGLDSQLNASLTTFTNTLATNDSDGDNRIDLASATETDGIDDPGQYDTNDDGYVDDYDFFVSRFDANGDGKVSGLELNTSTSTDARQLLELIDTFGDPDRPGYNDGFIDDDDSYAKIRGQVLVSADLEGWQDGAAGGQYQDFFKGPIIPDHGDSPLTFEASDANLHQFEPEDFDVSTFRSKATGSLAAQATAQAAQHDPGNPNSPGALGQQVTEEVPYGSAHPYDFYDRPVYQNMTFTNLKIPKGTNALFKNCKFIGCTFIETETQNTDVNFNYAGMQESNGSQKHPDKFVTIGGTKVTNTKTISNNIRFEGCTFEGAIVSDSPGEFTHVRNKIAFTGKTKFTLDTANLTAAEKKLYRRSTILTPHYSVEMGTFVSPADSNETVNLSGTIVAGVIDMRGQVRVNGTILTTFEPTSNTGPVLGETSPQFNTTLGYFPSSQGDLEAELPANGVGVIQVRYDPTLPLPDGISGPIAIEPVIATYFEGTE